MDAISINIKSRRMKKGLTLRECAERVDVTSSFLSQVETGKTSPSLSTLKRIADALDTTVGALIDTNPEKTEDDPVMREKDRLSAKKTSTGLDMYLLTSPDANKQMEPLLFRFSSNAASGEMYKHFGQEFVMVLKGSLEINLNNKKYLLKKGDSIYFNSSVPHSFRNIHSGVTEAVWVITPPSF